jgi:hypothetical protein
MSTAMSDSRNFFFTATVATDPAPVGPNLAPDSGRRRLRTVLMIAGGVAVVAGIVSGVIITKSTTSPHGPSTGLQARLPLHVVLPASLDGDQLDPATELSLAHSAAQLGVPAMALSTEATYKGAGRFVIVGGGPLPPSLRFSGNAQQADLIKQIRAEYADGHGRTPTDWGPKPTGALGGQLWCGTMSPAPGLPADGTCWMVDSQNVLNIVADGPDALATAEAVRQQVEIKSR